MKAKTFYVYHMEEFPSGITVAIFEPFEFEDSVKAVEHANFFHALSNLDYQVCSNLTLDEKVPLHCF